MYFINFLKMFLMRFTQLKDVYPYGPLIRVKGVEEWRKVGETVASTIFYFSSCVWGKQGEDGRRLLNISTGVGIGHVSS